MSPRSRSPRSVRILQLSSHRSMNVGAPNGDRLARRNHDGQRACARRTREAGVLSDDHRNLYSGLHYLPVDLLSREKMSKLEIRDKFLSDHRKLRAKAAVVTTLALSVLRGDEDLASALRLKGEELLTHLLDHMSWEEAQIIPLLVESASSATGESAGTVILKEHFDQRLRLDDSLTGLKQPGASLSKLAQDCIALVRWLEVDMAEEERVVLRVIVTPDPSERGHEPRRSLR